MLVENIYKPFVKLQCVKLLLSVVFTLLRSATVLLNCVVFCSSAAQLNYLLLCYMQQVSFFFFRQVYIKIRSHGQNETGSVPAFNPIRNRERACITLFYAVLQESLHTLINCKCVR